MLPKGSWIGNLMPIAPAIGSVAPGEIPLEASIKGRDLITGLPREVLITDADVREAMAQSIESLVESSREILETTPPEIVSDIMHQGIYLVGGGAMIRGLDQMLADHIKIPVYIAEDPLTAVARGAGIILENMEKYKDVLIHNEDSLPPTK